MSDVEFSPARAKLLEALGEIEQAEEELGAPIQYVAIAYCGTKRQEDGDVHEVGGRVWTDEPAMMTAALLRHAAACIEGGTYAPIDKDEDY